MSTPPSQKKSSNSWLVLALVSLFMFTLFMATIVFITWAYKDHMIATTVNMGVHAILTDTPLPEDQKKRIIHQTDRLYKAFLDQRITAKDLSQVVKHLLNGPVIPLGAVYFALGHYIEISELTPQQQADAQMQLGRMTRAGIEEKFKIDAIQPIVDLIKMPVNQKNPPKGVPSLIKENLTAQELAQTLELAQQLADDASMPNELYAFDPAKHIQKIIDQLLPPEAPPEVSKGSSAPLDQTQAR